MDYFISTELYSVMYSGLESHRWTVEVVAQEQVARFVHSTLPATQASNSETPVDVLVGKATVLACCFF